MVRTGSLSGRAPRCRRRGIALVLVLVAAAVAFTIASAYLASQATAITIARNAENHAQARYVAETGVRLTCAYVQSDPDWRDDQAQGTWVADQPFGPGTFTVVGEDGADADGDGVISQPDEGDGDLGDDLSDLLTLTVTGQVGDTRHIVRVVLTPLNSLPPPKYHWKLDETSGTVAEESVNGLDGILTNFTSSDSKWTTGQIGGALTFDESNDYIEIPSFPNLTGDFTITAWILPNNVNGDQRIFCDDRNNSGGFAFSLGDGGGGRLRLFNRGINPIIMDSSAVATAGVWQFVSCSHDAAARIRRLYHDGALVGGDSGPYGGAWGTDAGSASIGGEIDGTSEGVPQWRFGGHIDDVRIYDQVLTEEQLALVAGGDDGGGGAGLYDFATGTPGADALAYDGQSSTKLPTTATTPSAQLSSGEYDDIKVNDSSSHSYAAGANGNYPQMRFVLQTTASASTVGQLEVTLTGRNVNAHPARTDGVELHIWNYSTSAYEQLAVSASTESEVTLTGMITSNPGSYLGGASANTITLLAVTRAPKGSAAHANTLYVDYVGVTVTTEVGGGSGSGGMSIRWIP